MLKRILHALGKAAEEGCTGIFFMVLTYLGIQAIDYFMNGDTFDQIIGVVFMVSIIVTMVIEFCKTMQEE